MSFFVTIIIVITIVIIAAVVTVVIIVSIFSIMVFVFIFTIFVVSAMWAAGYGKVEKRVRTTGGGATGSVRNLRIREDTAKYLLNLDPSSAHYDPKSRSMREDPQPHKAKKAFAGDNFVRKSGDYHAWEAERMHQLDAYDHGATLHMQAAPSQAEILHQNFKVKKDKLQVSC